MSNEYKRSKPYQIYWVRLRKKNKEARMSNKDRIDHIKKIESV